MPWTSVRVTPADDRDAALAALFGAGAQGVHEDGDALVTHFPPETDVDAVLNAVRAADPRASVTVGETPHVQWDEWRANVGAHTVGSLTVAPPWLAEQSDPRRTIVIDPAMAFGTGEHATTRGVLQLMQSVIRPGDRVADLGAGSAVLSIAAARLGAALVAAIEVDPDATSNAQENIERNGVAAQVQFIEGDATVLLPLVAPVRVVLANIVSSVLQELLPTVASALADDGDVIISGMLHDERAMMLAWLAEHGWRVEGEALEAPWWSAHISRRA